MAVTKTYVAGKRLKVGGGWREPGQPVPEAANWPTLNALLSSGGIVEGYADVEEPVDTARQQALMAMNKRQVQNVARKLGIPVYGSKDDIVSRILEVDDAGALGESETTDEEE